MSIVEEGEFGSGAVGRVVGEDDFAATMTV